MSCRSFQRFFSWIISIAIVFLISPATFAQEDSSPLRRTVLKTSTPSDEIVRIDVDKDAKPDIVERWWNGKRVRWLDENGDLLPSDTRGDQVADVLQVDKNGDGLYDGPLDLNVKWADNDGDGKADLQAWVTQSPEWSADKWSVSGSHWMVFIDVEKDGVLGWLDWEKFYFVFDEDDDDHRWERVEMYYPMHGFGGPKEIDLYSTMRWRRSNYAEENMVGPTERPGIAGHPQADSLGDRGEFDEDNSGRGKLYVGIFDRKLHLAGAEWGAWLVDKNAEYHGGTKTPSPKPRAPRVEEVVKYTDADNNEFLDTVEYDYDGDRKIDFRVSLLDYRSSSHPHPDVAGLVDTHKEGWKGLNSLFTLVANQTFQEALTVYRAAWRRGLTTPEIDKLASASSVGERYDHGHWLKEKVFRQLRARLQEARQVEPARAATFEALEKDLARLYYLGLFDQYARRIADVPGK